MTKLNIGPVLGFVIWYSLFLVVRSKCYLCLIIHISLLLALCEFISSRSARWEHLLWNVGVAHIKNKCCGFLQMYCRLYPIGFISVVTWLHRWIGVFALVIGNDSWHLTILYRCLCYVSRNRTWRLRTASWAETNKNVMDVWLCCFSAALCLLKPT